MNKKILVSSFLGNFLEIYDFTLFGLLLTALSPVFFPSDDPVASLLNGYILFAVGFFARPVGAFLFSYIGDRYGRKSALTLSILCMSIPTACIAFMPTYQQIGILAPTLLGILRFIQGVCAGGEYNGAGLFVVEHAQGKTKFLYGALLTSAGYMGAFFASVVSLICIYAVNGSWAWRIPYLIGATIGLVGLYLRSKADETPEFLGQKTKMHNSYLKVLKTYWAEKLCVLAIGGMAVVPLYTATAFLNTFLYATGKVDKISLMVLNAAVFFLSGINLTINGLLIKHFDPAKMMKFACVLTLIFSWPLFWLCTQESFLLICISELVLLLFMNFFIAPSLAFMSSLFPVEARYRGTAIPYCLGMAIFGGTAPYLSAKLIQLTSCSEAPAFYLMIVSLFGWLAVHKGKQIADIRMNEAGTSLTKIA